MLSLRPADMTFSQNWRADMKIYDRALTPAETGQTQDVQKVGSSGTARSGRRNDSSGDHVEFSSTMGRLARTIDSYDTNRAMRVQFLASQYQSGKYQPDSIATSRALIADSLSQAGEAGLT